MGLAWTGFEKRKRFIFIDKEEPKGYEFEALYSFFVCNVVDNPSCYFSVFAFYLVFICI